MSGLSPVADRGDVGKVDLSGPIKLPGGAELMGEVTSYDDGKTYGVLSVPVKGGARGERRIVYMEAKLLGHLKDLSLERKGKGFRFEADIGGEYGFRRKGIDLTGRPAKKAKKGFKIDRNAYAILVSIKGFPEIAELGGQNWSPFNELRPRPVSQKTRIAINTARQKDTQAAQPKTGGVE